MKISKLIVAGLSIVLVTGLSSCGSRQKTYSNEDGTFTVDQNGGKVTFRGKDGQQGSFSVTGGGGTKIPADFPKDIAIYPKAKVISAFSSPGEGHSLSLMTRDNPDKVVAFYAKSFGEGGWEKKHEMSMGNVQSVAFEKDDRAVSISAMKDKKHPDTIVTVAAMK